MMMPENIELRIKDMTTLSDCIEEAKVCLSICQPSSLISSNDHIDSRSLQNTTTYLFATVFTFSHEEKSDY